MAIKSVADIQLPTPRGGAIGYLSQGVGLWTVPYTFSTTTVITSIATGTIRFDNATVTSATKVWVHPTDASGTSRTTLYDFLDSTFNKNKRGFIRLQHETDTTKWVLFRILTQVKVSTIFEMGVAGTSPIEIVASSGTPFANADPLMFSFHPAGFDNPMVASGDLIVGGASGAALAMTKGSVGQFVGVHPTLNVVTYLTPKGRPTVTVVAASNATAIEAACADVQCAGAADQTIINTALAAGSVMLTGGQFNITGAITFPGPNLTLEGGGPGVTTIFASNNAGVNTPLVTSTQAFTTLRNITIDGNKAQNGAVLGGGARTSMLLFNITGNYSIMESVHGKNSSGNGANFGSSGGVCNNVSVLASDYAGFLIINTSTPGSKILGCTGASNVGEGFYVNGSGNTLVGCTSGSNSGHGYTMVTGVGNIISGCVAKSNSQYGYYVGGSNQLLNGCQAISNGQYGAVLLGSFMSIIGCDFTTNTGTIALYITTPNNLVQGCYFYQNSQHGLWIGAADNSVVGNTFYQNGILTNDVYSHIVMDASADDCNVQMNQCRKGASGNLTKYGIQIIAGATANVVTNNDLKNSGSTSLLDGGTGTITTAGNRL